jgi:hypothetical protein
MLSEDDMRELQNAYNEANMWAEVQAMSKGESCQIALNGTFSFP